MAPRNNNNIRVKMLQLLIIVLVTGSCNTAPVTEGTLKSIAASLPMYVDELPQIPKLLGYSISSYGKTIKPGRLIIGMYQIQWVFFTCLKFEFEHYICICIRDIVLIISFFFFFVEISP